MVEYLMLGIVFAFAAAVQPGPLQAYLISQALTHGWRRTIFAAFAPIISDGPIIVLTLSILTQIPNSFLHILQLIGGFFLLYLAFSAWKTWRTYNPEEILSPQSARQTVVKAVIINLLNPNPYLGWSLVMGPLFLRGWHESPFDGIIILIGFYFTIVLCSIGIVLLFTLAKNFGRKINRMLIGVSAIALACFGIFQLWSGLTSP